VVIPQPHDVAQELERDERVGSALVLHEHVDEGVAPFVQADAADDVGDVQAQLGIDEGVPGDLQRVQCEALRDFRGHVRADEVDGGLAARERLPEEQVVGMGDTGHPCMVGPTPGRGDGETG